MSQRSNPIRPDYQTNGHLNLGATNSQTQSDAIYAMRPEVDGEQYRSSRYGWRGGLT